MSKTFVERAEKFYIRKKVISDKSKDSALLFEAAADFLRMTSVVWEYNRSDGACVFCGDEVETIEHFAYECDSKPSNLYVRNIPLREALGVKGNRDKTDKGALGANRTNSTSAVCIMARAHK